MDKSLFVYMKRLPDVRICNHCISPEENRVSIIRIEGNCGIHRERKMATKCPHWKDGTGMKEGLLNDSVKFGFFRFVSLINKTTGRF
jgi:hypothetical protein